VIEIAAAPVGGVGRARRLELAVWTAVVLLSGSAIETLVERLNGGGRLPAWLEDVFALAALAAIPLLVVSARAWRDFRASSAPDLDELARRRDEEEENERRGKLERRERVRKVLRAADGLTMVFQPIIDLTNGNLRGYEALARFEGDGGPEAWFAEAHAVGLGLELELLAVGRALEESRSFNGDISVNVSQATLCSAGLFALLEPWIGEPGSVTVELTEREAIADYEDVRDACRRLHALGVSLAVDDAGGGYASMRHVIDLAPDVIKLDRSLVADVHHDPARRSLLVSLVLFAKETKAMLVAEGIELSEELDTCRELGVNAGQGFLLGRPAPLVAAATR
jgi:EAL domain-containing protein (putative c-di-GMP-specific phosphodiesterase class I)